MSFLRYIWLKVCALFVRILVRLQVGSAHPKPTDVVYVQPSRGPGQRSIKVHIYRPANTPVAPSTPVLINFHGSGFIIPMHGTDDLFCRRVAEEARYTVLDVQYRLAPENPWPAANHDVEDIVNWVLARPEQFDLTKVAISGFSAGANMACVAAAVTFPPGTFSSLVAFYPPIDLSLAPSKKQAPDTSGKPLPAWMANIFNECYLPETQDRKDPSVSPLFAPVKNYPRNVLIVTAARDNLCLEGESLASKIQEVHGHHVVQYRAEQCDHAWDKDAQPGSVQEAARDHAYALAIGILQRKTSL